MEHHDSNQTNTKACLVAVVCHNEDALNANMETLMPNAEVSASHRKADFARVVAPPAARPL